MKRPRTPLPLTFLPNDGNFIVDARGHIAAEIPCQGVDDDKALGEYLAHCVNAHHQLVEAFADIVRDQLKTVNLQHMAPGPRARLERARTLLFTLGDVIP